MTSIYGNKPIVSLSNLLKDTGQQSLVIKEKTIVLNKSSFASKGVRLLADTRPFYMASGDISLNLPSSDIKLVAVSKTNKGPEHAVIVNLTKVKDIRTGQKLYSTDLKAPLSGINPFTNKTDKISTITDIMLFNSDSKNMAFTDGNMVRISDLKLHNPVKVQQIPKPK
jgi:hypothetical protein